jgi:hypothetical protein
MPSGLEERRERGCFGLSGAVDGLDNQERRRIPIRSEISAKTRPAMPPLRELTSRGTSTIGYQITPPRSLLPDLNNLRVARP